MGVYGRYAQNLAKSLRKSCMIYVIFNQIIFGILSEATLCVGQASSVYAPSPSGLPPPTPPFDGGGQPLRMRGKWLPWLRGMVAVVVSSPSKIRGGRGR